MHGTCGGINGRVFCLVRSCAFGMPTPGKRLACACLFNSGPHAAHPYQHFILYCIPQAVQNKVAYSENEWGSVMQGAPVPALHQYVQHAYMCVGSGQGCCCRPLHHSCRVRGRNQCYFRGSTRVWCQRLLRLHVALALPLRCAQAAAVALCWGALEYTVCTAQELSQGQARPHTDPYQ